MLGTFIAFLSRYGVDQVVVQRWFAAKSLKHARRAFWLNAGAAVFSLSLLALFGFAISAHSRLTGLAAPAPMAHFAALVKALPVGITGLLAAGLLAAAMSSLDSGIHSLSAVTVRDLLPRKRQWSMASLRLLTLGFGLLATLGALYVGRLGSLFVIANRVLNGLGAPLLALFLVALFVPRVFSARAFLGRSDGTAFQHRPKSWRAASRLALLCCSEPAGQPGRALYLWSPRFAEGAYTATLAPGLDLERRSGREHGHRKPDVMQAITGSERKPS